MREESLTQLTQQIVSNLPKGIIKLEIAKARSEQDVLSDEIVPGIYIKGITKKGMKFEKEYQKEFEPKKIIDVLLNRYDYFSINKIVENLKRHYKSLGIEFIVKNCVW